MKIHTAENYFVIKMHTAENYILIKIHTAEHYTVYQGHFSFANINKIKFMYNKNCFKCSVDYKVEKFITL